MLAARGAGGVGIPAGRSPATPTRRRPTPCCWTTATGSPGGWRQSGSPPRARSAAAGVAAPARNWRLVAIAQSRALHRHRRTGTGHENLSPLQLGLTHVARPGASRMLAPGVPFYSVQHVRPDAALLPAAHRHARRLRATRWRSA
ncbi:MAG: hypothetical protein MZW92_67765 [Comamonadaceae bacterium]|nr:hypothetical protein [Comamonadaceae bacterium]